ncbi:hypothetical protein SLS56_007727 [Neofusicoccum ribis]|uniref:AAA+ ATPase domain-containing protein n=1 Tax=Neofusicoccum ribis TaxID=45134 RepID=A0ABR3SM51_9PEZI
MSSSPTSSQQPSDHTHYTVGIGRHNVVIAVLPAGEYGKSSAAQVAKDMLHTFPQVRIGLMVGIGGGAPSRYNDIRLGDIVVSLPGAGGPGVIQYDYGKRIQGRGFRQTGNLAPPPMLLRAAVSNMKMDHMRKKNGIGEKINRVLDRTPMLRETHQKPGSDRDILYESTFIHPEEGISCMEVCATMPEMIRNRHVRTDTDPVIHYGLVGSADTLMKDAQMRDEVTEEQDILCFEMEAAGLMNQFPCLVIRGICDYSDSHKSKEWQGYASLAAAAYAKDLLSAIPPTQVEAQRTAQDTCFAHTRDIRKEDLKRWLFPSQHNTALNPSVYYNSAIEKRHDPTCWWFFSSAHFDDWIDAKRSCLWLYGIPGCGKTVLAATVVQKLREECLYFFFDAKVNHRLETLLRSLIYQLYSLSKSAAVKLELEREYRFLGDGDGQPSLQRLREMIRNMLLKQDQRTTIVLDAFDEAADRPGIFQWIYNLAGSNVDARVLVTSRQDEDIVSKLRKIWQIRTLSLSEDFPDGIKNDIRAYAQHRVNQSWSFERWESHDPKLRAFVVEEVVRKANGIFYHAVCQLELLKDCLSGKEIYTKIEAFPKDLDKMYDQILVSISGNQRQSAVMILQLLVFTEGPMALIEMSDAMTTRLEDDETRSVFTALDRHDPSLVLKICRSLVTEVCVNIPNLGRQRAMQLAHSSVTSYLLSDHVHQEYKQSFEKTMAKAAIFRICLAYFSKFGDASLPRISHGPDNDALPRVLSESPFAEWSSTNWIDHARDPDVEHETRQDILQFLDNHPGALRVMHHFIRRRNHSAFHYYLEKDEMPTPLYIAALCGLKQTVETLLKRKENKGKAAIRTSALSAACLEGHVGVLDLLLENKCDLEKDLLQCVCSIGKTEVVELLLQRKDVKFNEKTLSHALLTTFHSLAGNYERTIGLLLQHGAKIDQTTIDFELFFVHVFPTICRDEKDRFFELLINSGFVVPDARDLEAIQMANDLKAGKIAGIVSTQQQKKIEEYERQEKERRAKEQRMRQAARKKAERTRKRVEEYEMNQARDPRRFERNGAAGRAREGWIPDSPAAMRRMV